MKQVTSVRNGVAVALGGLALMLAGRPATAQSPREVPAIVNVYRADPSQPLSGTGIVMGAWSLAPEELLERDYHSFVVGPMQGLPYPESGASASLARCGVRYTGGAGVTVQDSYPYLAQHLSPRERMPVGTLAPELRPEDGRYHLILRLGVYKLPTKEACQAVLDNLTDIRLLPGNTADALDPATEAVATGRWRVLVHLPRGTGAPLAPTLCYPEAMGLVDPSTTNLGSITLSNNDCEPYWSGFSARGWQWVEKASEYGTGVPGPPVVQEPVPFYLHDPKLMKDADDGTVSRTSTTDKGNWDGTMFFNPDEVWENRSFDADQAVVDYDTTGQPYADTDYNKAPHAIGFRGFDLTDGSGIRRRIYVDDSRPYWANPNQRPIEAFIHAFDGSGGTFNTETPSPDWWLSGLHTVAFANADPNASAAVSTSNVTGTETAVGTLVNGTGGGAFGVVDNGGSLRPLMVEIDLSNPDGYGLNDGDGDGLPDLLDPDDDGDGQNDTVDTDDDGDGVLDVNEELQNAAPGVGMVEFQFEYETCVPYAGNIGQNWDPDPDTWNPGTALDAAWDKDHDKPLPPHLYGYEVGTPGQGANNSNGNTNQDRLRDPADWSNPWRVRRYCAWPFNPVLAGLGTPPAPGTAKTYQGGPIAARFVVAAVQVVPEDAGNDTASLAGLAYYDDQQGANSHYYPQVDNPGLVDDRLERPDFLLGYRFDLNAPNNFPFHITPGSSSERHRFYLRPVEDLQPAGSIYMWTPRVDKLDPDVDFERYLQAKRYDAFWQGYPLAGPLDAAYTGDEHVPVYPQPGATDYTSDFSAYCYPSATTQGDPYRIHRAPAFGSFDQIATLTLADVPAPYNRNTGNASYFNLLRASIQDWATQTQSSLFPGPTWTEPADTIYVTLYPGRRLDTGVAYTDQDRWDVRGAFDGVTTPPASPVTVPPEPDVEAKWNVDNDADGIPDATQDLSPTVSKPGTGGYSLGKVFWTPTLVDEIHIWTDAADPADWALELAPFLADSRMDQVGTTVDEWYFNTGLPDWSLRYTDVLRLNEVSGGVYHYSVSLDRLLDALGRPLARTPFYGARFVNVTTGAGTDLAVYEIKFVTRTSVRREVTRPLSPSINPVWRTTPGWQADPVPMPAAAVKVDMVDPGRDLVIEHTPGFDNPDEYKAATVHVDVPDFQPPSPDAQGIAPVWSPDPNDARTRYRGTAVVYLDDNKSGTLYAGMDRSGYGALGERQWDVSLYRLASRATTAGTLDADAPGGYQFVRWYEEDTGWTGLALQANATLQAAAEYPIEGYSPAVTFEYTARLDYHHPNEQRVSVEPYSAFELECSVGVDQRVRTVQKVIDFGKVIHGGLSRWIQVTFVNEGNVPVTIVPEISDTQPLVPIEIDDREAESYARLTQMHPVPRVSYEAGGGPVPVVIPQATVGSPSGSSASRYFRVGRLAAVDSAPLPVGQAMGNYSGYLYPCIDTDGDADADGDLIEPTERDQGYRNRARLKLTVEESPLWRIAGFWDNDTDRGLADDGALTLADLQPYDQVNDVGTFLPVPFFGPYYFSHPDVADATPTIFVRQDPSEMVPNPPTPPNQNDSVWVGWAANGNPDVAGSVPNWQVMYASTTRIGGTGTLTDYRSFQWPDATTPTVMSDQSATADEQRNLYPNVCPIPGTAAGTRQYLLLWHNERETPSKRGSFLQFRRLEWSGSGLNQTNILQIPDDVSGAGLNKQVPRALVAEVPDGGAGAKVLWVVWQTRENTNGQLGFNAIHIPEAYDGAASAYVDAVQELNSRSTFVNYALRTAPGLTNLKDPAVAASYRHEQTSQARSITTMRTMNVFYSAWSPLWRNQDVYWSRYRPMDDRDIPAGGTLADALRRSPMAENAFRFTEYDLNAVGAGPPAGASNLWYTVSSLPGGRIPFPRMVNEALRSNANHTVYAGSAVDWVMPPDRPTRSAVDTTASPWAWTVEAWNHRGFGDTRRRLFDPDRLTAILAGTFSNDLDPLVVLRVYQSNSPTGAALARNQIAAMSERVVLDLDGAWWDEAAGEWVLPITGPGWLLGRGVTGVRVHPGLGRVTFNKPLYNTGANAVYVYATYRPCAWRITTDPAVDAEPTAAFDPWERLVVTWRRTSEDGQGELWYRTFSLAVPLKLAPVQRLRAVVNDADSTGDFTFNGTGPAGSDFDLGYWSFTGSDIGGTFIGQEADGPWSDNAIGGATAQGFTLVNSIAAAGYTQTNPGNQQDGWDAAAMVHFSFDDIGRHVRIWYDTPVDPPLGQTIQTVEEATVVPGLGPERQVPVAGSGSESQPCLAEEHFYTPSFPGTPGGPGVPAWVTNNPYIMSSRFWLAWTSTRDLYVAGASPGDLPRRTQGGSNIFYGTFLPDFSPVTAAADPNAP